MGDEEEFVDATGPGYWDDPEPTTETIEGCRKLASKLFRDIESRFGIAQAQSIFSALTRPSRIPSHELKKMEVLALYWAMTPWPNKLALARELAEKTSRFRGKNDLLREALT